MYEFSHSLGHERTSRDVRVTSVLPPTTDIHRGRSFAGLLRGYSLLLLMGFTVVHSGTLECAQGRIFDRSRNPFSRVFGRDAVHSSAFAERSEFSLRSLVLYPAELKAWCASLRKIAAPGGFHRLRRLTAKVLVRQGGIATIHPPVGIVVTPAFTLPPCYPSILSIPYVTAAKAPKLETRSGSPAVPGR